MKKYINIDNVIYNVKNYTNDTKLKDTNAYIIGEYVYPYKGKIKKKPDDGVGLYKIKNTGEIILVKPIGIVKHKYSIDNIYELSKEYISNLIKTEGVKQVGDEALRAEMGEIFAPAIVDTDNELQRIIKIALQHKKIDLKNYEHRFKNATDMNNCKKALILHGTMSMVKFNRWCEILDIEYEISYRDKKGCANPMNHSGKINNYE